MLGQFRDDTLRFIQSKKKVKLLNTWQKLEVDKNETISAQVISIFLFVSNI